MNFLRMQDLVTFRFTDQAMAKVADNFSQMPSQAQPGQTNGLHVRIAATHSGIITRNNGFYLPEKMRRGAVTFTENYGKPVLIHHQEHVDPIGRIVDAEYVDTSGIVRDKWDLKKGLLVRNKAGKEIGTLNDALLSDFIDGRLPFGMVVDTVCSILRDTLLQDGAFEGLGYIQLVANIVDKDAVNKLLDGRYLTGSVGATTNKAICSVCRQDWTESGKCVVPGTMITLADGAIKAIEDIQVNDLVVTHTGSVGRVTKLLSRHYKGNLAILDRIGTNQPLLITEGHPIRHTKIKTVAHRINKSDLRWREKVLVKSGWIPSEALCENKGYLSTPVIQGNEDNTFNTNELALLGLYAAEGSQSNGNCLEFSLNETESEKFEHYFKNLGIDFNTYQCLNSHGISCRFSSLKWKKLVNFHIGHGAKTKYLSRQIVFALKEGVKAFLGAYIDGDGCFTKDQQKAKCFTASKNMAHQLLAMCHRIGLAPNFYKTRNPGSPSNRGKECWIYEIQISRQQAGVLAPYSVKLHDWSAPEMEVSHKIVLDGNIFSRFQYDEMFYHGQVYNLEVESPDDAHSYIANDIAVHNCQHTPGTIYDEGKCFIIAGDLIYDEYSFVNVPADRHSRVLQLNYNGVQDNVEIVNPGRVYEAVLSFPQFTDSNPKETSMAEKTAMEQLPVVITDKVEQKVKDTIVQPVVPEPEKVILEVKKEEVDVLSTLMDLEKLTDEQEEQLYSLLWTEVEAAVKDGELTADHIKDMKVEKIEDAKLSTEKRKKLSKSTFCGPDRSFPVPDCAHVTAARRLIGRYKGGGDKSKILACVSRKAKALGCGGSSKKDEVKKVEPQVQQSVKQDSYGATQALHMLAEVMESKAWSVEEEKTIPVLTEAEIQSLQGILKRLVTFVGKDALINALVKEELALSPACEDKLVDEIVYNEEIIGTLRDELTTLRKEYLVLSNDINRLQDTLTEQTKKVRLSKESRLALLKALDEKKVEKQDWTQLSDEALDTKLVELAGKVDINKIVDKISDGMSRNPTERVEDPTVLQDQIRKLASPQELGRIQENITTLLFKPNGQKLAREYIRQCQVAGKLPTDFEK